jgi:molybdate transport system substrate-binding protein
MRKGTRDRLRRSWLVGAAAALALAVGVPAGLAVAASGPGAQVATAAAKKPKKKPPALKPYTGPKVTVFAAASLTEVFQAMAPKMTYSFAGSDQLAFQIRQGAPADVFASANVRYPDELFKAGLVTQPRVFTYNNVVVITPKSNPAGITSVQDLAKPGVKLVVADASVPVGSYARTMFRNLGISQPALANVVSNETDVKAVVAKVALGEADAGVVYQTDVAPVKGKVTVVRVPDSAQPVAAYSIAVDGNTESSSAASRFVTFVLSKDGQAWLRKYGFIPAPA